MTATRRAVEQLATWPDLSTAPASCGTGSAIFADGREIVHLHTERDADVLLTRPVIERIHDELERSTAFRLHPGSAWATVHLDCDADGDLLVSLVSLCLKADCGPTEPCNMGRVEIIHTVPELQDRHRPHHAA